MAKRRREKMSEGKKNIIAIQEYDIKIIIVLIMVMLRHAIMTAKKLRMQRIEKEKVFL